MPAETPPAATTPATATAPPATTTEATTATAPAATTAAATTTEAASDEPAAALSTESVKPEAGSATGSDETPAPRWISGQPVGFGHAGEAQKVPGGNFTASCRGFHGRGDSYAAALTSLEEKMQIESTYQPPAA